MPSSKLWLPKVSTSKPIIRITRTVGSSLKKLDRGGAAPYASPAVEGDRVGVVGAVGIPIGSQLGGPSERSLAEHE